MATLTLDDLAELEAFIDKAYTHDFRLRMSPEIAAIVSLLLEERGAPNPSIRFERAK